MLNKIMALLVALMLFAIPVFAETAASEDVYFEPLEAEILNGEGELTEAYFENADYTFINFWATWCPPCVEELPALAKLSEETEGGVQVVGVLIDALSELGTRDESAIEAMATLLENAEADYPVLYPEGDILLGVMSLIQAVPTTVVVDHEGLIVDVVVGGMTLEDWVAYAQELPQADAGDA